MKPRRQTKRIAAWIACFAIVMAALAPSVSHLLVSAGKSGGVWAEICSAAGHKLLARSGAHADYAGGVGDAGLHGGHCPFCRVHMDALNVPGPLRPVAISGAASFPGPRLFYHSPKPLFAWTAAQSRGPPHHS